MTINVTAYLNTLAVRWKTYTLAKEDRDATEKLNTPFKKENKARAAFNAKLPRGNKNRRKKLHGKLPHRITEESRVRLEEETTIVRLLRNRIAEDWLYEIGKLPLSFRVKISHIVWWDFSRHGIRWEDMSVYLDHSYPKSFHPDLVAAALHKIGYSSISAWVRTRGSEGGDDG